MRTHIAPARLVLIADQRLPSPDSRGGPVRRYRIARLAFDVSAANARASGDPGERADG